jgi:two-component system alkaline phosphatase synthesis response regulator PhoP
VRDKKIAPFAVIADGDEEFVSGILSYLHEYEMAAVGASTFREVSRILADHFVSLLVVNVAVGGHSGIDYVEQLQRNGNHMPVIFIADRYSQSDRIRALEIGDDIVQKPIVLKELVARIGAVIRRSATSRDWHVTENVTLNDDPFSFCGATVYPMDFRVKFPCGDSAQVGRKEMGLMAALAAAGGAIISRRDIIHRVWGLQADIRSRSLDQYVVRIRSLFRANGCPAIESLRTIHGVGYMCNPNAIPVRRKKLAAAVKRSLTRHSIKKKANSDAN